MAPVGSGTSAVADTWHSGQWTTSDRADTALPTAAGICGLSLRTVGAQERGDLEKRWRI